jgi:hypothetical protein
MPGSHTVYRYRDCTQRVIEDVVVLLKNSCVQCVQYDTQSMRRSPRAAHMRTWHNCRVKRSTTVPRASNNDSACAPGHKHGAPHHELPHHDTEGVNVARLVQAAPVGHLRCHIEGRAFVEVALVGLALLHALCKAEVGDLRGQRAGHHSLARAAVLRLVVLHTAAASLQCAAAESTSMHAKHAYH